MDGLLNPADTLERQRDKLMNICTALMRRVEQTPTDQSNAFVQFERAALLDKQVRQRTADLERALDLLNESNARLAEASVEAERSRATLNEAIESVDEGFALFDSDDNLLLFNSRFCKDLVDIRDRLAVGMSFESFVETVSTSRELHLPAHRTHEDWARRRMKRHLEDRVVFNIALTRNRWVQVSEHRTGEGGTAVLQTDITDVMRKQHLDRARLVDTHHKMLRATLDHLAQGVCIFDERANIVGWNRELERMIQVPVRLERNGTSFSQILDLLEGRIEFVGPQSRSRLVSWSEQASDRLPIEFVLNDTNGRIFNVFAQEMPDRGFVMSFSDVTSERTAANNLRELNKTLEQRVVERTEELGAALQEAESANITKSRFIAAASHDLLQPLSAAKLYLATLQESDRDDQVVEISRKAESALKGAEDIIEALLDISKLDSGKATFDVRPFSLGATLTSLANEMAPIAAKKGLDLRVMPSSVFIVSDPVFFRRVLQNLISNAIKYTDQGRVLVGVRSGANGKVRVEVHDTGMGIAKRDHERIFQEFAQLEDSHSGAKGIGLGLAIVERVCTSLDHELTLRSTLGEGSCFSIGVERYVGKDVNAVAAKTRSASALAIEGKVILLVENDVDLSDAMTLRLERSGAHVLQAASGEDALALLEDIELLPDAALLDFQLGAGMNGVDLHRALSARYDATLTFILSANRSAELKASCTSLNLPLIYKPIDIKELLKELNMAFRQAK